MVEHCVAPGEAVITQGDAGDFFYIVDAGELECFVNRDGAEFPGVLVAEYRPGMTFGELALMYNTPRAATIIARTEASLFAIVRIHRGPLCGYHLRARAQPCGSRHGLACCMAIRPILPRHGAGTRCIPIADPLQVYVETPPV